MFFSIIERIQQRPLESRRRITFWIAFLLTCLIALLWLLTALFSSPASPEAVRTTPGPFEALFKGVTEGFGALKNMLPF